MTFNLNMIVAETKEDAIQVLEKNKKDYQILREDDQHYIVDSSYIMSRVCMVIEDGIVSEAWYG